MTSHTLPPPWRALLKKREDPSSNSGFGNLVFPATYCHHSPKRCSKLCVAAKRLSGGPKEPPPVSASSTIVLSLPPAVQASRLQANRISGYSKPTRLAGIRPAPQLRPHLQDMFSCRHLARPKAATKLLRVSAWPRTGSSWL